LVSVLPESSGEMEIFDLFKKKKVLEPAPAKVRGVNEEILAESGLSMARREELTLLSQFLIPQDMRNWSEEIFEKYIKNGFLAEANNEQKIQALSLSEIKTILKENGQKTSGKRDELIKRILTNLPGKIEAIVAKLPKLFICSKEVEERICRFRAEVKSREDEIRNIVIKELIENRIDEAFYYYKKFQMELPELWRKEPGELDKVKEVLGISSVPGMSVEELNISKANAATEVVFGRSVKGDKNFLDKWKFLEKLKGYGITENEYLIERLNLAKIYKKEEESVNYHDVIWSIMNKHILSIKDSYHLSLKYNQMGAVLEAEGRDSFYIRKLYMEFHLKSLLESEPYKLGVFKNVEICTEPNCCPSCRILDGKKYSIKKALSEMPLPNRNCININKNGIKVCNCSYEQNIDG
jgi:hypothetical protein